MTEYLTLDDVLAAAEAHLGRPAEIGDYGLLESAVARPPASAFGEDAYPTLHEKAAALLQSARAQPPASSSIRSRTRAAMSSRMRRTVSKGCPAGSSSCQSR